MSMIHILHADDEADIREIMGLAMGLDPHMHFESYASGSELIARAMVSRPDLILLDVSMPEQDGPATLVRLRAEPLTADIPVVFVTARSSASEQAELKALGAIGVLGKPFDPMQIAAQVRDLVSR